MKFLQLYLGRGKDALDLLMQNEILKEIIGAYPEILLEAFNSFIREGRFFADWKKQRLVLLRKGNKPLGIR